MLERERSTGLGWTPFVEFYSPNRFMWRFRLDQATVEYLADRFGQWDEAPTLGTRIGCGLSHRERVCLALQYFATGGSYGLIADSQNVSRSTVCRAVQSLTKFLSSHHKDYIRWPEEAEYPDVARGYFGKAGFPRVIGAVDGTHVPIMKPKNEERAFVNRKGYHSLNVMAVCDSSMVFTYVNPRMPGGSHDAYVYTTSQLCTELEGGLAEGFMLLGDSGYPLTEFLQTPLLHPENHGERRLNRALCRTRATVEQAFGLLKMRFGCLTDHGGFIMSQPDVCSNMVMATVCLHNLAIRRGVPLEGIEGLVEAVQYAQPDPEIVRELRGGG